MENERPELLEKTIQQGALFSHVTRKERNGYVSVKVWDQVLQVWACQELES